jgi:hypothetical protein
MTETLKDQCIHWHMRQWEITREKIIPLSFMRCVDKEIARLETTLKQQGLSYDEISNLRGEAFMRVRERRAWAVVLEALKESREVSKI